MIKSIVRIAMLVTGTIAWASASAQQAVTGMNRLSYTTTDVAGAEYANALQDVIPKAETLQWQVYVPETYNRENPPGVFVFVDPDGWGGMPDKLRPVFDRANLIWVGARRTGRPTPVRNIWTSIFGYRAVAKDYSVNLNRLYIGSAGSGALTAFYVQLNANEFMGAVYISGSQYWGTEKIDGLDVFKRKPQVFVTGSSDRAKNQVRADYERYKRSGVTNVKLIFSTNSLGGLARPEQISEAIAYLDSHFMR